MRKLTYTVEATEEGYTESLSFSGTTVSSRWTRTEKGMKCEGDELCEQLEKLESHDEEFLDRGMELLEEYSFLGMDLSDLLTE